MLSFSKGNISWTDCKLLNVSYSLLLLLPLFWNLLGKFSNWDEYEPIYHSLLFLFCFLLIKWFSDIDFKFIWGKISSIHFRLDLEKEAVIWGFDGCFSLKFELIAELGFLKLLCLFCFGMRIKFESWFERSYSVINSKRGLDLSQYSLSLLLKFELFEYLVI